MKWSPNILSWGLIAFVVLVMGYISHVQRTVRARMEKVVHRVDELEHLKQSVEGYQSVLESWSSLPSMPLPNVRQDLRDYGLSSTISVKEENVLTLSPDWSQRRMYLSVKPMSVDNLQTWLERIRTDVGWRVIAVDLKSGATPGHVGGEIVLAGLERNSGGAR